MSPTDRLPRLTALLPALFAASTALSPGAGAGVFRVGSEGAPCTHATLAAAVAEAAANGPALDTIYLSDSFTLTSKIDILNHAVEIAGGFSDCSDGDPGTSRSTIIVQADDAIHVHGGTSPRIVSLQGLALIRSGSTPTARLLRIENESVVFLLNTLLSSGAAGDGGNVWMSGPDAVLSIDEWNGQGSAVYNGSATGDGGGIFCQGGGSISIFGGAVTGNTAGGDGGGVYLNDCTLNLYDGQRTAPVCPNASIRGIVCNGADRGGGVFAVGGSEVNLAGTAEVPALVEGNGADEGGGLYLTGASTLAFGENAWIDGNDATTRGAGVRLTASAAFELSSTATCASGCSRMTGNLAATAGAVGGAIHADAGSDATIFQTTFRGNLANVTGSVVYATGAGTSVLLEGCLAYDNLGSNNDAYFDTFSSAELTFAFSTAREDTSASKALFDTNSSSTVRIFSSILLPVNQATGQGRVFDEPIAAGEGRVADCVLFQESAATLPPPADPGSQELLADPATVFASYGRRDLRLRSGSPAIDFCDTFNYTPQATDLELESRGFDVATIPDGPFGPYDLGADEWHPLLVADFEVATCSQWSSDTGGC